MRGRRIALLLAAPLLGVGGASAAHAAGPAAAATAAMPAVTGTPHPGRLMLLALTALSPAHPHAARLRAVERLTALADHGSAFAEYVIGSLYMWGPQRPHAVLPYNAALAREYLANAAIRGELSGMEALAQLDLQTGHPLQAMIWAQVLVYYRHRLRPAQKRVVGYLPELIARAQRALGSTQAARVLPGVNGVLVRYGPRIEAGLHRRWPAPPADCATRRIAPQGTVPDFFRPGRWKQAPRAVSLVMIYAVDPAGRIVDHAILNVLPDWHVRYQMRYPLAVIRFNPAPACPGLRPVIQPIHYIDHRYVMHWH